MDINIDVNDIKTCDDIDEGNNNSLTSSSSYLNGRWSYDEHIRFLKGCLLFGNNWKKVENYVKSRTSSQIRSHAQKFLIKLNKKYKVELMSPFSHSQKYVKNAKHKIGNETLNEALENLSQPNIDMEKVEKVILNIFFMNGSNQVEVKKKDDCLLKDKYINTIDQFDINNLTAFDFDFKRKIFTCEKIPKDSPLKEEMMKCLESNEPEDRKKIQLWINSDNIKVKNLFRSLCFSENHLSYNTNNYINPFSYYYSMGYSYFCN